MYDTSSGCYHLVVQRGQLYSSFLYDGDQVMSGTLCNLFVYKRELDLLFGSLEFEIKGIRMAKAAKRLNAILDYMRKVKSSMSMVFDLVF
uniref:Uncharacterized protein n=1 Tax=Amphimedon queenslandica TaxID=400682 RepID=A0A1X7SPB6_AMPQE